MKIKYGNETIKEEVNDLFRETLSPSDGLYINYGDHEDSIEFSDGSGGDIFYCVLVDLFAKYTIDLVDYYHFIIKDRKENVETK